MKLFVSIESIHSMIDVYAQGSSSSPSVWRSDGFGVLYLSTHSLINHSPTPSPPVCVSGLPSLAGYVEVLACRLGMQIPDLNPKQADMWQTRVSSHAVSLWALSSCSFRFSLSSRVLVWCCWFSGTFLGCCRFLLMISIFFILFFFPQCHSPRFIRLIRINIKWSLSVNMSSKSIYKSNESFNWSNVGHNKIQKWWIK